MKRVKWIICALCILFPVFLLFICGVMLIGVSDESEDGDPVHASGLGLSDKVREYAAFVGDTAAEYNIHEYEKYLLAIMMVESGGEGNDPMQSLGNSGLTADILIIHQSGERLIHFSCRVILQVANAAAEK